MSGRGTTNYVAYSIGKNHINPCPFFLVLRYEGGINFEVQNIPEKIYNPEETFRPKSEWPLLHCSTKDVGLLYYAPKTSQTEELMSKVNVTNKFLKPCTDYQIRGVADERAIESAYEQYVNQDQQDNNDTFFLGGVVFNQV